MMITCAPEHEATFLSVQGVEGLPDEYVVDDGTIIMRAVGYGIINPKPVAVTDFPGDGDIAGALGTVKMDGKIDRFLFKGTELCVNGIHFAVE